MCNKKCKEELMKRKLLLLLFLLVVISGCSSKNLKENVACEKNWAICTTIPFEVEQIPNGQPVKVAILDSGINQDISQLSPYVVKGYNAIDNSSEVSPLNNHGTMIASIIAGTYSGKIPIGLNKQVEIYDVQVLDKTGVGAIEHTISGIEWAIENKVDIINMSYGFSKDEPKFHRVIQKAEKEGIILVAASGNTLGLSIDYPAKYKEVLSISAIDKQKNIFIYAGKGKVDYVAPGVEVPVLNESGKVDKQTGTSFAAAYATGIISVLKTSLNSEEITEYLNSNALELGSENVYGKGLIQYKGEE